MPMGNFALLLMATVAINCFAGAKGNDTPQEIWFESKVDNFNSADSRTFKQRCLVNASAWKKMAQDRCTNSIEVGNIRSEAALLQ